MSNPADSPIEEYLDELVVGLAALGPRRQRHLLAEAEAHLHDLAAELAAGSGGDRREIERRAVARFGPVSAIAGAEQRNSRLTVRRLLAQLSVAGLQLGAVGAVAVGVSGLIAGVIRMIGGVRDVADLSSGPGLTPASCVQWVPAGSTLQACQRAALSDWAAETVFYRLAVGVLGVGALGAAAAARRCAGRREIGQLPRFITDTIAAAAFGVAAVWTLGLGVDASVLRGASGQWFSAAVVAGVAAGWFGARLIAELRGLRIISVQ